MIHFIILELYEVSRHGQVGSEQSIQRTGLVDKFRYFEAKFLRKKHSTMFNIFLPANCFLNRRADCS